MKEYEKLNKYLDLVREQKKKKAVENGNIRWIFGTVSKNL